MMSRSLVHGIKYTAAMAQVHLSDINGCLLLTGAMRDGLIRLEDSADQNVDPLLKHSLEIGRILSLKSCELLTLVLKSMVIQLEAQQEHTIAITAV